MTSILQINQLNNKNYWTLATPVVLSDKTYHLQDSLFVHQSCQTIFWIQAVAMEKKSRKHGFLNTSSQCSHSCTEVSPWAACAPPPPFPNLTGTVPTHRCTPHPPSILDYWAAWTAVHSGRFGGTCLGQGPKAWVAWLCLPGPFPEERAACSPGTKFGCVTWGKGEVKEGTQLHSEVRKKFNGARQKSL